MMRMVALAVLVAGALVAPAWAGEIYSWTDNNGAVHYSNTATPGAASVSVTDSDTTLSAKAPAAREGSTEGAASSEDEATFSTQASLQRTAIERSMRDVERRLADVDSRLAVHARARTSQAGGSVSTGGVGTNAADLLSP